MAITAAIATVAGTVSSISSSKKAEKENKRAAEQQRVAYQAEQRRAEVQNVRSIRQQVRAARMAQGQMTNTAALTGGLGGSGLAGGMAVLVHKLLVTWAICKILHSRTPLLVMLKLTRPSSNLVHLLHRVPEQLLDKLLTWVKLYSVICTIRHRHLLVVAAFISSVAQTLMPVDGENNARVSVYRR
jgi:hypothetical protein